MLEGHFMAVVLHEDYRDSSNWIYHYWQYLRCITAPLFFTISGIVFTYLLTQHSVPFFQNIRVKKGFFRFLKLLFWGYFLLINFQLILKGKWSDYFIIFHVLQCIGVSIFLIICLYGIQKIIRFIPLGLLFALSGLSIFILSPTMHSLEFSNVPQFVENIFVQSTKNIIYKSMFPIFPWVGFALFGAAIGAFIRKNPEQVYTNWFSLSLIGIGIAFNFIHEHFMHVWELILSPLKLIPFEDTGYQLTLLGRSLFVVGVIILIGKHKIALKNFWNKHFQKMNGWVFPAFFINLSIAFFFLSYFNVGEMTITFNRLFQFFLFVSIVWSISKLVNWNMDLFIKIGQNTLSIFIIHAIILFGGITGFGLNKFLFHQLGIWPAMVATTIFVLIFVYYVKYLEEIEAFLAKINPFKTKM